MVASAAAGHARPKIKAQPTQTAAANSTESARTGQVSIFVVSARQIARTNGG